MASFSSILEKRDLVFPFLYGISDRRAFPELAPLEYLDLLFDGSAPVVQLREKDLDSKQLLPMVRRGVQLARRTGKVLLVNSELELASSQGADGCHLTSAQDLSEAIRLRQVRGREQDFLLGKSVHSISEALRAETEGADYVMLGPVFEPLSKQSHTPPLGLSGLREAARVLFIPVVAVGGIEPSNLPSVFSTGVIAAAGISWVRDELARRRGGVGRRAGLCAARSTEEDVS